METVAIVGVGLIGGSLGLALQKAGFTGRILGVSSKQSLTAALGRGAIHAPATLEEAAAEADLLYLAQPIGGILETIDRLAPLLRRNVLVTDAGSTKVEIVSRASASLRGCQFLGGHPMAGKEARGVEAADGDLFGGRTYCLTPLNASDLATPLASSFIAWIQRCGARPLSLSPDEHDRTVAFTSHLPQLASTALAAVLADVPTDKLAVAGPGALDMTRLALSAYELWHDILVTNRNAVDHALSVYIDKLTEVRHNLQTQQANRDFKVAADAATRLRR